MTFYFTLVSFQILLAPAVNLTPSLFCMHVHAEVYAEVSDIVEGQVLKSKERLLLSSSIYYTRHIELRQSC